MPREQALQQIIYEQQTLIVSKTCLTKALFYLILYNNYEL